MNVEMKIKHLEFIQNIISRMASNSFKLKGWTVTLFAAILVLVDKVTVKQYVLFAYYIPPIVFWILDAYYLSQERLYRALYEKVRKLEESKIDFSLKATRKEFINNEYSLWSSFRSKTEMCFYLPLILVAAIIHVMMMLGCFQI